VASASPSKVLFEASDGPITAGRIRNTAAQSCGPASADPTDLSAHGIGSPCSSRVCLLPSERNLAVFCPAHLQPAYLREIDRSACAADGPWPSILPASIELALSSEESAATAMPEELDLFFYTSGVTGAPKLVAKKIERLDSEAAVLEELWPNGARRVLATVSHQHIYGMLFRIFWPVLSGGVSSDKPAEYWEQLAAQDFFGHDSGHGPGTSDADSRGRVFRRLPAASFPPARRCRSPPRSRRAIVSARCRSKCSAAQRPAASPGGDRTLGMRSGLRFPAFILRRTARRPFERAIAVCRLRKSPS
jgi:hypothetical protein